MPNSQGKKTQPDIEDGYGLDSDQVSRKKNVKNRKRELENMYASEPFNTSSSHGYSKTKMTASLPTHLDFASPDAKGESKSKHKSKGDKTRASIAPSISPRGDVLQESENSMRLDDLVCPTRNQTSSSRNRHDNSKEKRDLSRHLTRELSMHQNSRHSTGMDNTHIDVRGGGIDSGTSKRQQRGRSQSQQRGRSQSQQRGRSRSLQRERSQSQQRGRSHSSDRSNSSRLTHARGQSLERNQMLTRGASLQRSRSMDRSRSLDRSKHMNGSYSSHRRGERPTLSSHLSRSRSISRTTSGSGSIFLDGNASVVRSIATINGQKMVVLTPISVEQARHMGIPAKRARGGFRRFVPKEVEERPPRSLVMIWVIVAAELCFDLATTIIAFNSFLAEDECCGEPIQLGSIPLGTTVPFLLLVVAEVAILLRAIIVTLWPSMMTNHDDTELDSKEKRPPRSRLTKFFCCFLRLKIKMLMHLLNLLVLLNPFFGCIIAWILMYQSDKKDAFTVLGMEGASLILHFVSVWLEGALKTYKQIAFHCIPVIPFALSIALVLYYLKEGGVCYLVDEHLFKFTGCEICNVSGVLLPCLNSTNFFSDLTSNLNSFDDVKNTLIARSTQGSFCATNLEDRSFCFYDYDDGQVEPVNQENWMDSFSAMPTAQLLPDDVTSAPATSPEDVPPGSDTSAPTSSPATPTFPSVESALPSVAPAPPTRAPVNPTPPPTDPPTLSLDDSSPTSAPVEEPPVEEPPESGGEGSDGFNMDEVGSDGFNPNDLFR